MSSKNCPYLQLIKYVIKNINSIHKVNDITTEFGESIKEITNEKMGMIEVLLHSNMFLGQKAYFFSFEDSGFKGEFSLDFLPEDYHVNFKSILLSEGHPSEDFFANFRGMLFSEDSSAIEKEYKMIFEFFKNEYGLPNNEEADIIMRDAIKKECGRYIDTWHTVINNKNYGITFYKNITNFQDYQNYQVYMGYPATGTVPSFLSFAISRTDLSIN